MSKKIVIAAALALVMVGISTSSASAACSPPKSAGTYNTVTGAYVYWTTSIPMAGSTLVGKVWDAAGDHTGTCNTDALSLPDPRLGFLYWNTAGNAIGMKLPLGASCVAGCPGGFLSVDATVIGANGHSQTFLAKRTEETPGGGLNFDYSLSPGAMCDVPCPTVVTSSSVDATHKSVTIGTAGYSGNCIDATAGVTGWNIVSAASAADPGTDASLFSVRSFLAAAGGGPAQGTATLDCSNPAADQWVTMQLMTTAGGAPSVCPARRVNCNPLLADPKLKGIAPKKINGPGQISK